MFWKCNYLSSPHIEVLLNKEDVSLHEVMDEENVLEECRIQNKKLIDYLSRPDVMEELVTLTTVEPSGEMDERARYKYSNIACELLTCDVPALNERLAGDEALLGKLYSFLEADCPLNPLLASFFSKTIGVLVARKSEQNWYSYQFTCLQVLEFLKSKENCISLLMKHLGTSAIMDLVLKLIIHVQGPEMKQNILNWLDSQQVVQCLVGLLDPSVDAQRHANASQLLCDVIKMSREKQLSSDRPEPDPILNTLESPETVTQLLDHILSTEKCETAIVGGISVLLALLDCNKPNGSSVDINKTYVAGEQAGAGEETSGEKEQPSKIMLSTSHAILPYLKDLHNLLLDPPQKPSVKTTAGALDPPLGNSRLHIAKLLAALLATNSGEVNKELANLGTLEVLLDLFFKYTWNNFLHTQVEQCLYYALESELNNTPDETTTHTLLKHIFVQCQLLEKILKAWEENETQQSKPGGRRHGYMGHLIKIANHVVDHACKGPLADFIKENVPEETATAWDAYVTNTLSEINKTHNIVLGGPPPVDSNTEDDTAYQEMAFQQPQMYRMFSADFQLPQMSPQFIDNYDIHDDEFGDGDENLHEDRMNNKAVFQNESDFSNDKLFKLICDQKTNAFEGEDEAWNDHDDEDDDTPTFDQEVQKDKQWPCNDDKEDESKEQEDDKNDDSKSNSEEKKEVEMEVDTLDPWTSPDVASEGAAAPVDVDAVNPWACNSDPSTVPASSGDDGGWADFGNAGFADFEANFSSQDVSENKETDNNVPQSALGNSENVTTNVPTTSEYNFPVVL